MKQKGFVFSFAVAAMLGSALVMPSEAQAFGLNDLKSKAGAIGGSSSSVDVASLTSRQEELMAQFSSAMENMLLAQSKTLEAAGHKEDAMKASAAAANYSSGNIDDPKAIERDTELTQENQAKIDQMLSEQEQLSDEGRAALAEAVPYYAKGMYDGYNLPDAFQSWSANAKDGVGQLKTNPGQAAKLTGSLNEVTTVTTSLPTLVKSWGGTTKTFITYAKGNSVDVSDVESKLGDL